MLVIMSATAASPPDHWRVRRGGTTHLALAPGVIAGAQIAPARPAPEAQRSPACSNPHDRRRAPPADGTDPSDILAFAPAGRAVPTRQVAVQIREGSKVLFVRDSGRWKGASSPYEGAYSVESSGNRAYYLDWWEILLVLDWDQPYADWLANPSPLMGEQKRIANAMGVALCYRYSYSHHASLSPPRLRQRRGGVFPAVAPSRTRCVHVDELEGAVFGQLP
jgi:hypothetical protein